MSRVVLIAAAREEALEAFRWYEQERPGLGKLFRARLNEAVRRIRSAPASHPMQHRDLRRVLLEQFPYSVFYRVLPAAILIVGVIHNKRSPLVWRRRAR